MAERVQTNVLDLLGGVLDARARGPLDRSREAQLRRIKRFIDQNLRLRHLDPEMIAHAFGISTRYLHKLFSSTPYTLGEWVRQQRLEAVHRQLRDPHCHQSIGELAFRWGFNDQAQFTRAFRQQFGCTAREVRASRPH